MLSCLLAYDELMMGEGRAGVCVFRPIRTGFEVTPVRQGKLPRLACTESLRTTLNRQRSDSVCFEDARGLLQPRLLLRSRALRFAASDRIQT
jgi:hypothetical protein